jgi:hypothetical protein
MLLALMAYTAEAQITSGTIIVVNQSKDKLVVAADSRTEYHMGNIRPNDSDCKIATFKHQIVFAAIGSPESVGTSDGKPVPVWSAYDAAWGATRNTSDLHEIVLAWIRRAHWFWETSYSIPKIAPQVRTAAEWNGGNLVSGIFAKTVHGNIVLEFGSISFNKANQEFPIKSDFGHEDPKTLISCGQEPGKQIYVAGHSDVAAKFCSERETKSKIEIRTPLKDASEQAVLATKLVEMTIDAYQNGGDVGGHVNVVTLSNDGHVVWNADADCHDNDD